MSTNHDIAAVQVRLAKARSDRDAWRTSGMQEKYLEAYSMVDALELELDRLRKQGLRSLIKRESESDIPPPAPVEPLPSAANAETHVPGQWQRLMARIARR